MTRYVVDSYAWIEYLDGSTKGARVEAFLRNAEEAWTPTPEELLRLPYVSQSQWKQKAKSLEALLAILGPPGGRMAEGRRRPPAPPEERRRPKGATACRPSAGGGAWGRLGGGRPTAHS